MSAAPAAPGHGAGAGGGGPVVDRLSALAYTIPTDAPEADGTLAWQATTMVVVQAEAAGRVGLG